MPRPAIQVHPSDPTIDTALEISVDGLPPGGAVTLEATTVDRRGKPWAARAGFRADQSGRVSLAGQAPESGSYQDVSAMGLVWSMTAQGRADKNRRASALEPSVLTIVATPQDHPDDTATATVHRRALPEGVQRVTVRSNGLVGTLFWPRSGGPHPGVLLLGGSEGGLHELDAALLAGHGFAVLALAYFGMRGLPEGLVDIPLEYFSTGVTFLSGLRRVRTGPVGLVGGSRGGEVGLLVAAADARIGAVVSVVGSGVVTPGIPRRPQLLDVLSEQAHAWTKDGRRLPHLPHTLEPELTELITAGQPVRLAKTFRPALADPDVLREAEIAVERTRAAVLVVTAGDDRIWPCAELTARIPERLPARCQQLHFPDAGHLIAAAPYGPATGLITPGPGVRFDTGGSPAANAAAREAWWQHTPGFLAEHLG